MSDATTDAPSPKVQFLSWQSPTLKPGGYTIQVTQAVSAPAGQQFAIRRTFAVRGPRYALDPTDLTSAYPADASLGGDPAALPHVVLNRGTLPWERSADVGGSNLPWLALLLFDQEEKPTPTIVPVGGLATSPGIRYPARAAEAGGRPDDSAVVIDVKWGLLDQILPKAGELSLLAHVRRPLDGQGDPSGDDLAVVVGNRPPRPGGASTVHLVSLEGRYSGGAFDPQGAGDDDLIRLVSLESWSFTCIDASSDLPGRLRAVDRDPSTVRLPSTDRPSADAYLATGATPLAHSLRWGGNTVSWYHGPLAPAEVSRELSAPVRAADALTRYDPTTGMFDVSYAAAWEVGRMLALRSKAFSTALYLWKRASVHWLRRQEQQILHPHLPYPATTDAPAPPPGVAAWFDDLRILRGVPFDYLVPDERMLPVESIRFFWVDHSWVECLMDGAFGVGRVSEAERDREDDFAADPAAGEDGPMTGFVLRSEVVDDWPGLVVDAVDAAGKAIDRLRLDRLSSNVLIGLFRGEVARVSFSLKPDSLHFGLDPEVSGGVTTYAKNLRDFATGAERDGLQVKPVPRRVPSTRQPADRVIDVAALAAQIGALTASPDLTAAQFAIQMIEGTPRVDFDRHNSAAPPARSG